MINARRTTDINGSMREFMTFDGEPIGRMDEDRLIEVLEYIEMAEVTGDYLFDSNFSKAKTVVNARLDHFRRGRKARGEEVLRKIDRSNVYQSW